MNIRITSRWAIGTVAGLVLAASAAHAQTARSGGSGGGQTAQLMQQMQQLASERTALQAENAKMKKELAEMTRERDTLKSARSSADQRIQAGAAAAAERSARERETLEAENQRLKDRMQELIGKQRETIATLHDVESERTAFKQSLDEKNTQITACVAKNQALYKLNDDVLTRFENQGVFSRMASAEPFTKIQRVRLQNLIDDYRYKADEQKVAP